MIMDVEDSVLASYLHASCNCIAKIASRILVFFINPRRMRSEGYSSRSVVCVCVSVYALQSTK